MRGLERRIARLEGRRRSRQEARSQPQVPPATSTLDFARRFRRFPFPVSVPDFHEHWYNVLDDPDQGRIVLLAPREHAKTSVVLTYVLHRICQDRSVRIGIVSSTDALAKAFLRELVRELETNDDMQRAYGGAFKPARPKKWTNTEITVEGSGHGKDVSIFALGAGSQLTGRHCDLLVLDDIETKQTVSTPERRAKTREWFMREMLPVLSPTGKIIVVGTRKHYDDLYEYLLSEGSGWRLLDNALSAIVEVDGELHPLWPDRWTLEGLRARKQQMDAVDVLAWPQEYENRPIPSETQMFNPWTWLEYYELPEAVTYYQAWDLAISEKQGADYTVGVVIAVDDDNNVYIVDVRRGHWTFRRTQEEIEALGSRYLREGLGLAAVGIEAVAYQAAAVQEALRQTMLPVVPLQQTTVRGTRGRRSVARDKVSRARILEARAAVGKVFRPGFSTPWWADLAQELAFFPAGKHDDQVDAFAYAMTLASQQATNYDYAYRIYRCQSPMCKPVNYGYRLEPEGRACPRCGTPPDREVSGRLRL